VGGLAVAWGAEVGGGAAVGAPVVGAVVGWAAGAVVGADTGAPVGGGAVDGAAVGGTGVAAGPPHPSIATRSAAVIKTIMDSFRIVPPLCDVYMLRLARLKSLRDDEYDENGKYPKRRKRIDFRGDGLPQHRKNA
jgi:hypothetical protein